MPSAGRSQNTALRGARFFMFFRFGGHGGQGFTGRSEWGESCSPEGEMFFCWDMILNHGFQIIYPSDNVNDFHSFENVGCDGFTAGAGEYVYDIVDNVMVVLRGAFVGAVVVAGVGGGKGGEGVIVDVAVLDFVHVLSADFEASVSGGDEEAALKVAVPYCGGVA